MIAQNDILKGYVHTDNISDTHGFRVCHNPKRAWCNFYGPMADTVVSRRIWLDHLGDYYVLDLGCSRFVKLDGSECSYEIEWE